MPAETRNITAIQHALSRKGFDPGNIDGVWGRRTEAAVRAFQTANGLLVDGIVGPKTAAKLLDTPLAGGPISNPALPWLIEARQLLGTAEIMGRGSNPTILSWANGIGVAYNSDDIPWCGLFVGHCIAAALPGEPLPNNPLGARNWERFGVPCGEIPGAIAVFWRKSKASGLGHVGFLVGNTAEGPAILGGNQGNKVSVIAKPRDRLLAYRWPARAPIVAAPLPQVAVGNGFDEAEV
jgi:uncharacterized protein (TIGR02594 family)